MVREGCLSSVVPACVSTAVVLYCFGGLWNLNAASTLKIKDCRYSQWGMLIGARDCEQNYRDFHKLDAAEGACSMFLNFKEHACMAFVVDMLPQQPPCTQNKSCPMLWYNLRVLWLDGGSRFSTRGKGVGLHVL